MPKSTSTNISFRDLVPSGYRVKPGNGATTKNEQERRLDLFLNFQARTIDHFTCSGDPRRNLTSQEKAKAERCKKDVVLSYLGLNTRTLVEHQKPMATTYAHMHRDLGSGNNARRKDLSRDLEQLAGSAADSENLRRMVDQDAPWSFQNPQSRIVPSKSKKPTLFSYENGFQEGSADLQHDQIMAEANQTDEKTRHRSQIAYMPTEPMKDTFSRLYDGTLPPSEYETASKMYQKLTNTASLHSMLWTKKCETELGSIEGWHGGELLEILEEGLKLLDPNRQYDYRLEDTCGEGIDDDNLP